MAGRHLVWRLAPILMLTPFVSTAALAQTRSQVYGSALTKFTQTAFVRGEYGFMTYESETTNSNATGTALTMAAGGYAGEHRLLGVYLTRHQSKIDFSLNSSSSETIFNDLCIQPRFWYFLPSVVATWEEFRIKRSATETLDIKAHGWGGGLGIHVPITSMVMIFGDGQYVVNRWALDANGQTVKLMPRTEIDVGASIALFADFVKLTVGYRHRMFGLEIAGVEYAETQSSPYFGAQAGLFF